MESISLEEFEKKINYSFNDKFLLLEALTSRAFVEERCFDAVSLEGSLLRLKLYWLYQALKEQQ